MLITYESQNKQLANDVLERNFYKSFRTRGGPRKIELFLTGACKANCDYCYLKKYQKDLYPLNLHNPDQIIHNLQLVLDWYIENEFVCMLDIFSAEWLTSPIADRVFDCFYETFSKVEPSKRPPDILLADNMQFLKDATLTAKVKANFNKIKSLGINVGISASIDGKYCDYGRTENDDEFYIKLKEFLLEYKGLVHPMVSADNVKYWIDNYAWWRANFPDSMCRDIMSLEVRNGDWNEDSIQDLIRFCDFLIDYKFEEFNYDKTKMLKYIFHVFDDNDDDDIKMLTSSYNIIGIQNTETITNEDHIGCSSYGTLPIRLGDLSVAPCHRLYYPELEIGKFNVQNDKIIDFNPTNVSLLIMMCHLKRSCIPHCERCNFNEICVGHCLGASYEAYGNMLVPQMEVCKMYTAKNTFLLYKYYTMGLFDNIDDLKRYLPENRIELIKTLVANIVGEVV